LISPTLPTLDLFRSFFADLHSRKPLQPSFFRFFRFFRSYHLHRRICPRCCHALPNGAHHGHELVMGEWLRENRMALVIAKEAKEAKEAENK